MKRVQKENGICNEECGFFIDELIKSENRHQYYCILFGGATGVKIRPCKYCLKVCDSVYGRNYEGLP